MVDKNISLQANYPAVGGTSAKFGAPGKEITFKEQFIVALTECKLVEDVICTSTLLTITYTDGSDPLICPLSESITVEQVCQQLLADEKFVESVTGDCVNNTDPVRPVINLPNITGNIVAKDENCKDLTIDETITSIALSNDGCSLTHTNEHGTQPPVDIWSGLIPKVQALIPPENVTSLALSPDGCSLAHTNELGLQPPLDIWSGLIPKVEALIPPPTPASTFGYDTATHTVTHNGVPWQLNCGEFNFDPATCDLSYTDEKGRTVTYPIPQDRFIYDLATCTLTILDAKGSPAIVVPVGVPADQVSLNLVVCDGGCQLDFRYKESATLVPLPNMIVGTAYDQNTNTLTMLHCDGTSVNHQMPASSLTCNVLEDGTQILCFDSGFPGGKKLFNIPGVVLDTDNLTVAGAVLTFQYGGDGNPGVVTVDICQIVADNCNATFTEINPDGSWSFVDNAGTPFTYPAPVNCCTFHGNNPAVINPAAPPATPAGTWPTKRDRDTAIECHPNGLSFWTCIGGNWSLDFVKTFGDCCAYHVVSPLVIDLADPPVAPPTDPRLADKADRDTVLVSHSNGWCAYTCVAGVWARDWCKVDPVLPGHTSPDNSVSVVYNPATNEWEYTVVIPTPYDPAKETFKAGDTLPDAPLAQPVVVCLTNGQSVTVNPGDTLPPTLSGCVQIDETDGTTAYIPSKREDCCHYQIRVQIALDPDELPTSLPSDPAGIGKSDGDTLHACYNNGSCYFTCASGAWVLDFCKVDAAVLHTVVTSDDSTVGVTPNVDPATGQVTYDLTVTHPDFPDIPDIPEFPDDCCHYHAVSNAAIGTTPPATPPNLPGVTPTVGDTLHADHPNGGCYYSFTATGWVLDFCRTDCCNYHEQSITLIDPNDLPTAPTDSPSAAKSEGDTLQVCHPNGACYYTCLGGVWTLDFCKLRVTKEEIVEGFTEASCPVGGSVNVLTDDCTKIDVKEMLPCANTGKCQAPPQSLTVFAPTTPDPFPVLAATELSRDMLGNGNVYFFGTGPLPGTINPALAPAALSNADFPYAIAVPAHNPDAVLALHVIYGGHYSVDGSIGNSPPVLDDPTISTSFTTKSVGDCDFSIAPTQTAFCGQSVWLLDTGGAAGSIDLDFLVKNIGLVPPDVTNGSESGVVQIFLSEVVDTNGNPLNTTQFDCGAIYTDIALGPANLDPPAAIGADFDTGEWDALVFAGGRHVQSDNVTLDYATGVNVDTEWITVDNASDVYEASSLNGYRLNGTFGNCQLGTYMGVVPGGSGAGGWQWNTNALTNSFTREASLKAIPVVCPEPNESVPVYSFDCTATAENTNCLCDSVLQASVCAGADLLVRAGHIIKVIPVVDGVALDKQMQIFDNSGFDSDTTASMVWAFSYTGGQVAPGQEGSATLQFCVVACLSDSDVTASAEGSLVNLREDWEIDITLVPVC